jgi:FMN reductase
MTHSTQHDTPFIVGLGGTTRAGSSSERALALVLEAAEDLGARTRLIGAGDLQLPLYAPEHEERTPEAVRLVEALAAADGVVIASPGYHGGPSGLIKNALDYMEDLRDAPRTYLDGVPVGCIACAHGWQATTTTLQGLRSVVHALRGWPTPFGAAVNSAAGGVADPDVRAQLRLVGRQVVELALLQRAARSVTHA